MNNTNVESYLKDGCGRCELFQTPQCKVHLWTEVLVELRRLVQASGLDETMKWGSPCYTLDGKNVVMLTSFKENCALAFMKGTLLEDPEGLLVPPGPNSHHARQFRFTSVDQVHARHDQIVAFLAAAIEIETSGRKTAKKATEPMPQELQARLEADASLADAFGALTPGRRRSYILHVGGAKQSKTRAARAERCEPKIRSGKGFNER